MSQLFVETLKVIPEEIDLVNTATFGQHKNDNWNDMHHLLVTGKKVKGIYTQQKNNRKPPRRRCD